VPCRFVFTALEPVGEAGPLRRQHDRQYSTRDGERATWRAAQARPARCISPGGRLEGRFASGACGIAEADSGLPIGLPEYALTSDGRHQAAKLLDD